MINTWVWLVAKLTVLAGFQFSNSPTDRRVTTLCLVSFLPPSLAFLFSPLFPHSILLSVGCLCAPPSIRPLFLVVCSLLLSLLSQVASDDYSINNPESGQVVCNRVVVISQRADLELLTFPFDRQTFSFSVRACTVDRAHTQNQNPAGKRLGVKFVTGSPRITYHSKVSEWVPATPDENTNVQNATGSLSCFNNDLRICVAFERQPWYYLYNIVLVLFLITCMAAYTFSISPNDSTDRLELNFTLVLTTVAFKYTVSSYLPRITYLTLMDKYVLLTFMFLGLTGLENAVVAVIVDDDLTSTIDKSFLYGAGGLWLLMHMAGVVCVWRKSFYNSWGEKVEELARDFGKGDPFLVRTFPSFFSVTEGGV
jgi:hypothetical protein